MEYSISKNVNNVYYADVHIINGKGCFFTGSGKTYCGQKASSAPNASILDLVGLVRKGNDLFAYSDSILIPETNANSNSKKNSSASLIKIEYFIFCFDEKSTESTFGNDERQMLTCGENDFFQVSRFNICYFIDPNDLIKAKIGNQKFADLVDEDKRGFRFIESISGLSNVKYRGLPWMKSAQDKVDLLSKAIS